jgi:hypothetical protein
VPPPKPPADYGYYNKIEDVDAFYWRWRLSEYSLTLTGSYIQDMEEYPDFWADVYTFQTQMSAAEEKVKATLSKAQSNR